VKPAHAPQREAPESPENLIATEPQIRPAPNWKDVPLGMAALFHEGCKLQPGHSSEPPAGPQRRECRGKFNVRLPKSLHAALAGEAEAEGVSLNQLVVAKLALHLQVR
jgi:hypothetical protein